MSLSIDGSDAQEAADELDALTDEISDAIKDEFAALLEAVVDEARSNVQNNTSIITGDLHASIQVFEAGRTPTGYYGVVGTELEYAVFVEYGRGAVRPVIAKVLHWIDPDTGKDVYSMYSAPSEPQPFFEPAIIVMSEAFAQQLAHRVEMLLRNYGF
jgi:hypothetical protein